MKTDKQQNLMLVSGESERLLYIVSSRGTVEELYLPYPNLPLSERKSINLKRVPKTGQDGSEETYTVLSATRVPGFKLAVLRSDLKIFGLSENGAWQELFHPKDLYGRLSDTYYGTRWAPTKESEGE